MVNPLVSCPHGHLLGTSPTGTLASRWPVFKCMCILWRRRWLPGVHILKTSHSLDVTVEATSELPTARPCRVIPCRRAICVGVLVVAANGWSTAVDCDPCRWVTGIMPSALFIAALRNRLQCACHCKAKIPKTLLAKELDVHVGLLIHPAFVCTCDYCPWHDKLRQPTE